eukprot:g18220.t1
METDGKSCALYSKIAYDVGAKAKPADFILCRRRPNPSAAHFWEMRTENCIAVDGYHANDPAEALNLVFVGMDYETERPQKWTQDVADTLQAMQDRDMYSTKDIHLNAFRVDGAFVPGEHCRPDKKSGRMKCDTDDIIRFAAKYCGNGLLKEVIAIVNRKSPKAFGPQNVDGVRHSGLVVVRRGEGPMAGPRGETGHRHGEYGADVVLHELGHSFGLGDEYSGDGTPGDAITNPNCDKEECPKWADLKKHDMAGCHP